MRRRRWWIASALFVAPLLLVSLWLLSADRTYESTGVVTLTPAWVPAIHPSVPIDATPAEAMAAEQTFAEGEYGLVLDDSFDFPFTYEVETDPAAGTIRFVMHAPSATEAWGAALDATAGYVGLHSDIARVDQSIALAQAEVDRISGELAAPEVQTDPTRLDALNQELATQNARLTRYVADREVVAAGGTAVVTEPAVHPDEPTSPDFFRVVTIALAAGVVLAGLALLLLRSGAEGPGEHARTGRQRALGVIVLVAAPCLLLVVGLSGLHSVWELRRVTDAQVERQLDCARRWMDTLPEGSTIYPQPEGRQLEWVAVLGEAAVPRLDVVIDPAEADLLPQIVPEYDERDGVEPCAGYKLVVTRP